MDIKATNEAEVRLIDLDAYKEFRGSIPEEGLYKYRMFAVRKNGAFFGYIVTTYESESLKLHYLVPSRDFHINMGLLDDDSVDNFILDLSMTLLGIYTNEGNTVKEVKYNMTEKNLKALFWLYICTNGALTTDSSEAVNLEEVKEASIDVAIIKKDYAVLIEKSSQ